MTLKLIFKYFSSRYSNIGPTGVRAILSEIYDKQLEASGENQAVSSTTKTRRSAINKSAPRSVVVKKKPKQRSAKIQSAARSVIVSQTKEKRPKRRSAIDKSAARSVVVSGSNETNPKRRSTKIQLAAQSVAVSQTISCDICGQTFTMDRNLLAHKRNFHSPAVLESKCLICNAVYRNNSFNLKYHMVNEHGVEPNDKNSETKSKRRTKAGKETHFLLLFFFNSNTIFYKFCVQEK